MFYNDKDKAKVFILNKKIFFYYFFYPIFVAHQINIMKKETRGRKPLPVSEKKKPLIIMVKSKHIKEVKPKLKEIEREYSTR